MTEAAVKAASFMAGGSMESFIAFNMPMLQYISAILADGRMYSLCLRVTQYV